jgi:hypothetical protein
VRQAALLIVLLATGSRLAPPQAGTPEPPSFEIDKGSVVRRDAGHIRWSTRLGLALDDLRLPQLVWDAKRLYVRHRAGVTAFSTTTGIILWHSPGLSDRLLVSRDRLLATEEAWNRSRWVLARTVTTGAEVWKFDLPEGAIAGLPRAGDWLVGTGWSSPPATCFGSPAAARLTGVRQ